MHSQQDLDYATKEKSRYGGVNPWKNRSCVRKFNGFTHSIKGYPLTYNKDMQEDKEGMFDTVHTIVGSLKIFEGMVRTMTVHTERLHDAVHKDFSNATELADYLAAKGMPFREAHEVTGKLVFPCIQRGIYLLDLPLEDLQKESDLYEARYL